MKIKENPTLRTAVLTALSLGFAAIPAYAATVTWDGGGNDGLWATAANWNPDKTPTSGDTFLISTAVTVTGPTASSSNLPLNATIVLSGNAALTTNGGAIRTNGSNITVNSGSSLTGAFWDLNNATLNLANGAVANMVSWEQKGTNVFNFALGSSGFSTLTPGNFWISGAITNATYNVDMAAYTGGAGIITLMDFTTDRAAMDNTLFQTAGGLNVLNAGGYAANLQWNNTTEAIELNITAVPEPSSLAIFGLGALAIVFRRRRLTPL